MSMVAPCWEMVSPGKPITRFTRIGYCGFWSPGRAMEDDDVSSSDRRREFVHDDPISDLERRCHRRRRDDKCLDGVGAQAGRHDADDGNGHEQGEHATHGRSAH
jgi:hypothetical protein